MRRVLLCSMVFCLLTAVGSANAATKLTSKNSVVFQLYEAARLDASGIGCGSSASVAFSAQKGAYNMKLTTPKVGEVIGVARVSAVAIVGNVVTITLVADGADICTPTEPDPPPSLIPWSERFQAEVSYDFRMRVPVRSDLTRGAGTTFKIKPRTIWNGKGPLGEKFYGLKWRGFGSKTAVGKGRVLQIYCRKGDNCPLNRKRAKLRLSNPGFCAYSGRIEYRHIRISVAGRFYAEAGDERRDGVTSCGNTPS